MDTHSSEDVAIPSLEAEIYRRYSTLHFGGVHRDLQKEYPAFRKYYHHNYSQWLPQQRDARIVDLACGFGHFLHFLRASGYNNFVGVDSSDECVRRCQEQELPVVRADMFEWLSSNQADVIVANDVLEHLSAEALDRFMFYVSRVLAPGGQLIVKVPNAANPITGCAGRYIDYTHRTSFTELSLRAMLRVHFEKVDVRGQKLFVFYSNPLNYFGIVAQSFFDLLFRCVSIIYGQRELRIFKKSLIAVAEDPSERSS